MPLKLSGARFGRLTAINRVCGQRRTRWLCQCDCGNTKIILTDSLRSGRTKSCGCLWKEAMAAVHTKHGHARANHRSSEFMTWAAMVDRCSNPNHADFANYGGRGIKVCKRWLKFENFLADMGKRPAGQSLDRKNNNGIYSKRNCRWATSRVQNNNRRPRRRNQER